MNSLYDDSHDMLLSSMLFYAIVDLRNIVVSRRNNKEESSKTLPPKNNELTGGEKVFNLPISSLDIFKIFEDNEEIINDELGGVDDVGYRAALNDYIKNTKSTTSERIDITCVVCDDTNQETELIYGIWTCSIKKQIIVTYRGCTTIHDWMASGTTILSEHNDPVSKATHPPETSSSSSSVVSIHKGFYDYLFDESVTNNNNKDDDDDDDVHHNKNPDDDDAKDVVVVDTRCVYDKIKSHLNNLQKEGGECSGYQVYVTGHSLGAAMATIFSYYYAADRDKARMTANDITPQPIMCFPAASPMVGNIDFARSFSKLEQQGRLRCLRVTNHNDIFIQIPDRTMLNYVMGLCCPIAFWNYVCFTCCFSCCCQRNVYRHVGIDLHLYKTDSKKQYKLKYPHNQLNDDGGGRCSPSLIFDDWRKHMKQTIQRAMTIPFVCCPDSCICKEDFNVNHGCKEYMERLDNVTMEIKNKNLNDLYDEWKPIKMER